MRGIRLGHRLRRRHRGAGALRRGRRGRRGRAPPGGRGLRRRATPSVVRFGEADDTEFLIRFRAGAAGETPRRPLSAERRGRRRSWRRMPRRRGAADDGTRQVQRLELALRTRSARSRSSASSSSGRGSASELRRDGLYSLGVACLADPDLHRLPLQPRFAPGAVVALVHDVADHRGDLRDRRAGSST